MMEFAGMDFPLIATSIISGAVSGLGAFIAIRIEIALLKHRMDRADEDRKDMKVDIGDAHERIDSLSRSRMKTI